MSIQEKIDIVHFWGQAGAMASPFGDTFVIDFRSPVNHDKASVLAWESSCFRIRWKLVNSTRIIVQYLCDIHVAVSTGV